VFKGIPDSRVLDIAHRVLQNNPLAHHVGGGP
jgi:hypothetical protein